MDSFEDRVKNAKLTKANRLIAEYCLNNPSSVAFQSAADLGACIGVSDVSIVRFARALGYDGFSELKRAWQDELLHHIDSGSDTINPVTKFVTRKKFNREHGNFNSDNAYEIYCSIIQDSLSGISPESKELLIDRLSSSNRKYVVGIRTRSTAATAMATVLRMILPGVTTITTEDYASYMKTIDFDKDDCIVFFTFGRFSNFEQALLKRVKESGAFLAVITDKRASQAALAADVLIHCAGDINLPFYSSVGTVAIAEYIAFAVLERNWEQANLRIEYSEIYLNKDVPRK